MDDKDYAVVGITGCATGFLWSAIAGEADLSKGQGWLRATLGCLGSAVNSEGIFVIVDHFSSDRSTAWTATEVWWGLQGASSLAHAAGRWQHWEESGVYNGLTFPIHYAATPLSSTLGFLYGGLTYIISGDPDKRIFLYGGMLAFSNRIEDQWLPFYRMKSNTLGAVASSVPPKQPGSKIKDHELGHGVQFSILGDFGMGVVYGFDALVTLTMGGEKKNRAIESWADDYAGVQPLQPPKQAEAWRHQDTSMALWTQQTVVHYSWKYSLHLEDGIFSPYSLPREPR